MRRIMNVILELFAEFIDFVAVVFQLPSAILTDLGNFFHYAAIQMQNRNNEEEEGGDGEE